MIFRDDDIRADSDPNTLERIHNIFVEHNRVHTLGIQLEGLYNTPIWYWMQDTYMETPYNIQFGLHCWTHRFYHNLSYYELIEDFNKCIDYWNEYRGNMPAFKMFFPPNSLVSPTLYRACEDVGLICINFDTPYPSRVIHWGEVKDGGLKLSEIEKMLVQEKENGN